MALGTGPAIPVLLFSVIARSDSDGGDLGGEALRLPRFARNDRRRTARNDTGDITQCHTIKVSLIYLNGLRAILRLMPCLLREKR